MNYAIVPARYSNINNNNNNNSVPIAVEFHCPIDRDALQFLSELGKRLVETTGDVRASSLLFQWISIVVQRLNSVSLHNRFIDDVRPE